MSGKRKKALTPPNVTPDRGHCSICFAGRPKDVDVLKVDHPDAPLQDGVSRFFCFCHRCVALMAEKLPAPKQLAVPS